MSWHVFLWVYPIWESLAFLGLGGYFISHFREFFNYFCCFSVTQHVWLFATSQTAACQFSLSFSTFWSWHKLMSIELVMPSDNVILCHTLLFIPSIFLRSGPFPMSLLFTSGGQSIGASASVLPMNIQGWLSLGLIGLISLQPKGLSRVFSSTTVQKHQFFRDQLLYVPTLTSIHDYWKNHSFDYTDLCGQSDVSAFYNLLKYIFIACDFFLIFWNPYVSNVNTFNVVLEVSETILISFYFLFFILLCFSYFYHSFFQLTYPLFCFNYSVILPSNVFLISVMVLFIAHCLLFISTRLLNIFVSSWSVTPVYLSVLPFYFYQLYPHYFELSFRWRLFPLHLFGLVYFHLVASSAACFYASSFFFFFF